MGGVKKYSRYIFVPIGLASVALSEKLFRPFQLYVFLKTKCSGKLRIDNRLLKEIGSNLGLKSERAVKNNLKILIKKNWIGYNKKSKYYFIRSFNYLCQLEQVKRKTAAEFNPKHIKHFKAFLAGSNICSLVNHQRWKQRKLERLNGGSNQRFRKSTKYYPVACKALAKCLKISISTAFEWKGLAVKRKYVLVKKNFKPFMFERKKPISAVFKNQLKRALPNCAHLVRVKKGNLFEQDIDTFYPCIRLKRKRRKGKKIET